MFHRPERREQDDRRPATPQPARAERFGSHAILALQQSAGNAAVTRGLQRMMRDEDEVVGGGQLIDEIEFDLAGLDELLAELDAGARNETDEPKSSDTPTSGYVNPLYGLQANTPSAFGSPSRQEQKKPAPKLPAAADRLRTGAVKVERKLEKVTALEGHQSSPELQQRAQLLLNRWQEFLLQRSQLLKALKLSVYSQSSEIKERLEPILDQEERQEIIASQLNPKGQHQFTGVLDAQGLLQAACTWEVQQDDEGVAYLYVHELTSAPWNIWIDDSGPEKEAATGSGTEAMKLLIAHSISAGCAGRLRLVAWGSSKGFYAKLGFVPIRIKRNQQDLSVWDLSPEAAAKVLSGKR